MAKDFFTQAQQELIIQAIQEAEKRTSGEIKVHVEQRCPQPDVMERAKEVFALLEMHRTQLQNGVLLYLSLDDHQFAILGDKGIHSVVSNEFWHHIKDTMRDFFRRGQLAEGLGEGIRMAGEQLRKNFPRVHDDINELPDDISFGS